MAEKISTSDGVMLVRDFVSQALSYPSRLKSRIRGDRADRGRRASRLLSESGAEPDPTTKVGREIISAMNDLAEAKYDLKRKK